MTTSVAQAVERIEGAAPLDAAPPVREGGRTHSGPGDQQHADLADFRAIGRVIAPWGRRIGDLRFETDGAWKRSGSTVDLLAKELRLALQYPEGAIG